MDFDLKDLDLYGILGIEQSATVSEIKSAYRKKALQCHPDKNPDKPNAAQSFLQLSRILAILTDTAARSAYDKSVKARISLKSHEKKRERLIDIFKRKNETFEQQKKSMELFFEKEFEEFKKNSFLLSKQRAPVDEQLRQQQQTKKEKISSFKLKVKWMENGVYNKENLTSLFSKYGDVAVTVVALENRKHVAFVEYRSKTSAINAINSERGYPNCPVFVSFIKDDEQHTKKCSYQKLFRSSKPY